MISAGPADLAPAARSGGSSPRWLGALLGAALLGAALLAACPAFAQPTLERAIELHLAGRGEEALAAYEAFLASPAAEDSAAAATGHNNACLISNEAGEFRRALPHCLAALELRRSSSDPQRLARTLNNVGFALLGLGRYDEASQHFREALDLNLEIGEELGASINRSNLGLVADSAGRYEEALSWHAAALERAEELSAEPWAAEQAAIARINQGVVLERLGAFREALQVYDEVGRADLLASPRRASLALNRGTLYRNLGDPVTALEAFREAATTFSELGDTGGLAAARLNAGLALHRNLERYEPAEAEYRLALEAAEQSGDQTLEIQSLFNLGSLLVDRGRIEEAERVLSRCLLLSEESGVAEGKWSALDGLARAAEARGDSSSAAQFYLQAVESIERLRAQLGSGRRGGFFGGKRAIFVGAVRVHAALDAAEPSAGYGVKALELVQRAKARELIDALGRDGLAVQPADAEAIVQSATAPTFEYFLGEDQLWGWRIDRSGVSLHSLGSREEIARVVATVQSDLAAGRETDPDELARLGDALLGPLTPLPAKGEPLFIAADGILRYLPFEILPIPGATERLLDRVAVSYLPSASSRLALDRGSPRPRRTLLGFGDPMRSPDAAGAMDRWASRFPLADLPGARQELERAMQLLGGESRVVVGAEATEAALRSEAAAGARVVHFAAHTVLDERLGGGGALLLAGGGPATHGVLDERVDGVLGPAEIAELRLRSDLTILAACSSALAAGDHDGSTDALSSLTGAFLAAGSSGVLATLWDVDDAHARVFMEQFYDGLGRGLAPAQALAAVKRKMSADPRWARPDLWAGYVLVGDPPPVVRRGSGVWLIALAGLSTLAAAILLWSRRPARAH